MNHLFPAIKPFHTEMLQVSDGHTLYVEQSGTAKGVPILYLHGGPGAGMGEDYRRFFDPEKYWVIGFDQRGCGKSTPFGQLENNSSEKLVDDVLAIQQHLQIEKWLLFGGSWGSTLALLTAIRQPESVMGLILRGIFLAREQDYDWYLQADGGAAQLFPEYYQDFLAPVRSMLNEFSIVDAYSHIFARGNEVQKMAAIKAWSLWETRISRLHYRPDESKQLANVHSAISLALLECHYIKHKCFIPENDILQKIDKIKHLPSTIIHGRYDCVCKIEAAFSLSKAWDNSQLHIIPEAGHSSRAGNYSGIMPCHSSNADISKERT
ncbi:prolyl aminopeptidase [Paraglaciecola aquimarina]|uniref:Proline iminopeptidase n=1 Tax=Paraglaciecola aquimarina TaxID=1235557 RepID=A0ABU3SSC3_9ALTE|nr:prolyl aminopeptidase [Paraglaciecola aquimarina]MDU0352884.1 prolyl aminopeptidase [Paraglaciecola aquimarina]